LGNLLAAPDKFRFSATAPEIAAAASAGAREAGWTADEAPLSDGGEGLLDVVGGLACHDEVTGPLGTPAVAEWRLVPGGGPGQGATSSGPTAVIEMARASGLVLAGGPAGNDPVEASSVGVGELVLKAVAAGAARIVVGCGGSATTDGGKGALRAIGSPEALSGVELVAAFDVRTSFVEAAEAFGPQKGATPDQVEVLRRRLSALAAEYRNALGVDVTSLPGAGAAGGLAGGLAAFGARLVPGFELVAELVGLEESLARADIVMTGEGRLDRQSFAGKVVGEVTRQVGGRRPILCVVGDSEKFRKPLPFRLVSLTERYGRERSLEHVLELVKEVVADQLSKA
jgi:glycerate 2-kinase